MKTTRVVRLPAEVHFAVAVIPQGLRVLSRRASFPDLSPWKSRSWPPKRVRLSAEDAGRVDDIHLWAARPLQEIYLAAIIVAGECRVNPFVDITSRIPGPEAAA